MIDCPICQQKNDDDARFCAECGQRLTGAAAVKEASPPPAAPLPIPPSQTVAPQPPAQPKLVSPLLSGAVMDNQGAGSRADTGGEVDRLRQMSARTSDKPDPTPGSELPFKNPFDPRNTYGADASPTVAASPTPTGKPKSRPRLHSPLLEAEEFEDGDPVLDDTPPAIPGRGGKFRSPLLGGGSGGGAGQVDNYYDAPPAEGGGGGLRSPLLGGGAYTGGERRLKENPGYGGSERRAGLRSPLLSSAGDSAGEYFEGEDAEYDPYEDDDNPNVLRSPLLAARSHGYERKQEARSAPQGQPSLAPEQPPQAPLKAQAPVQAPAAVVAQAPPPPVASPPPMPPAPASAEPAGWPVAAEPAGWPALEPQSAPAEAVSAALSAAPAPAQVSPVQAESEHFHRTRAQTTGSRPVAPGVDPRQTKGVPPLPQVGGPSMQLHGNEAAAPARDSGPAPLAIPAAAAELSSPPPSPPTSTPSASPLGGSFISSSSVSEPPPGLAPNTGQIAAAALAAFATQLPDPAEPDSGRRKGRSRILDEQTGSGSSYESNEPYPANDMRQYGPKGEENPIIKLVGFAAIGIVVLKVFAIFGYATSPNGSQYFQFMPWVIEQLVGLGTAIGVAVLALLPRR